MSKIWRIADLLSWTTNYFMRNSIDSPRLEAEILLARVLNMDRVYLYANFDRPVDEAERDHYKDYIRRRVAGEPSAYIVGYREFMSLDFKVTNEVLIPRPDTEVLVESIIELVREREKLRICDIGTGSGAIAVSLAHYLPNNIIYATDISSKALNIAQENALKHKVKINFLEGNLLSPVSGLGKFDIIAANLPYISPNDFSKLANEVKDYEPELALIAEGDGLDLYRQLIPEAYDLLTPKGYLFFEISYDQGTKALKLVSDFAEAELIKDYAGLDRLIMARKG